MDIVTDKSTLEDNLVGIIPINETYFCGAVVVADDGRVSVIKYYSDYKKDPDHYQWRFSGCTSTTKDETPQKTFERTAREEFFADGNGRVISIEPFLMYFNPNSFSNGKDQHTKMFGILKIEGKTRREDIEKEESEDEKGRIHRKKLGPPEFISVSRLAEEIFVGHRLALSGLCKFLSVDKDDEFSRVYRMLNK